MCIVSAIFDHYQPLIPKIEPIRPYEYAPKTNDSAPSWPWTPQVEVSALQKLIDEFREAVEAAKKLDKLMGKPDCEDPDKARLTARVAELEREIETMKLREENERLKRRVEALEKSERRENPLGGHY